MADEPVIKKVDLPDDDPGIHLNLPELETFDMFWNVSAEVNPDYTLWPNQMQDQFLGAIDKLNEERREAGLPRLALATVTCKKDYDDPAQGYFIHAILQTAIFVEAMTPEEYDMHVRTLGQRIM